MNDQKTFVTSLVDTFQIIGPSRAKAMFGGYSVEVVCVKWAYSGSRHLGLFIKPMKLDIVI